MELETVQDIEIKKVTDYIKLLDLSSLGMERESLIPLVDSKHTFSLLQVPETILSPEMVIALVPSNVSLYSLTSKGSFLTLITSVSDSVTTLTRSLTVCHEGIYGAYPKLLKGAKLFPGKDTDSKSIPEKCSECQKEIK